MLLVRTVLVTWILSDHDSFSNRVLKENLSVESICYPEPGTISRRTKYIPFSDMCCGFNLLLKCIHNSRFFDHARTFEYTKHATRPHGFISFDTADAVMYR